jgi:hypothetical protein
MSICGPHTGAEAKCRNEQSQTHTRTQGGIEAVVTAMGRHAENAKVQEEACMALWNFAADHPENQHRIKRAGGGEAVKRAISAPGAKAVTKKWGQWLLDAVGVGLDAFRVGPIPRTSQTLPTYTTY